MILVTGGFGWKGIEIVEKIKNLNFEKYDKIITNGFSGFGISCILLKKLDVLENTIKHLKPYLNIIDKDYFFIGNIKNCMKLSHTYGNLAYELKEDNELKIDLEIELINLKTEEIILKKVGGLKEAFFYSTLLPGLRPPFNDFYNTASFTRTPCYSLLEMKDEEIEIYEIPYEYYKHSTIQRLYKSIQVIRSKYFYELGINKVKSKNRVRVFSLGGNNEKTIQS